MTSNTKFYSHDMFSRNYPNINTSIFKKFSNIFLFLVSPSCLFFFFPSTHLFKASICYAVIGTWVTL